MSPLELLVCGLSAVVVFGYVYRADFEKYSIFTVGVFKRVTRTTAADTDYECSELYCSQTVTDGERRNRYKEVVIAGCPIIRYDGGSLYCCEDHVSFEFVQQDNSTTTHRIQESVAHAVVGFLQWQAIPKNEESDELAFDDVTTATGNALDLAGIAFIIVIATVGISVLHSLHND